MMRKVISGIIVIAVVFALGASTLCFGKDWLYKHDKQVAQMAIESYKDSEEFEADAVAYVDETYYNVKLSKKSVATKTTTRHGYLTQSLK